MPTNPFSNEYLLSYRDLANRLDAVDADADVELLKARAIAAQAEAVSNLAVAVFNGAQAIATALQQIATDIRNHK